MEDTQSEVRLMVGVYFTYMGMVSGNSFLLIAEDLQGSTRVFVRECIVDLILCI